MTLINSHLPWRICQEELIDQRASEGDRQSLGCWSHRVRAILRWLQTWDTKTGPSHKRKMHSPFFSHKFHLTWRKCLKDQLGWPPRYDQISPDMPASISTQMLLRTPFILKIPTGRYFPWTEATSACLPWRPGPCSLDGSGEVWCGPSHLFMGTAGGAVVLPVSFLSWCSGHTHSPKVSTDGIILGLSSLISPYDTGRQNVVLRLRLNACCGPINAAQKCTNFGFLAWVLVLCC